MKEGLEVELIVMQAIQTIQATLGNSTQFASTQRQRRQRRHERRRYQSKFGGNGSVGVRSYRPPGDHQRAGGGCAVKEIGTGGVGSLAEILTRQMVFVVNHVRPEDGTILATGPSHVDYLFHSRQKSSMPRRCRCL